MAAGIGLKIWITPRTMVHLLAGVTLVATWYLVRSYRLRQNPADCPPERDARFGVGSSCARSDLSTPAFHGKLCQGPCEGSIDRCEILCRQLGTQLCIGALSLLLRLGFVDVFGRYSHVGYD